MFINDMLDNNQTKIHVFKSLYCLSVNEQILIFRLLFNDSFIFGLCICNGFTLEMAKCSSIICGVSRMSEGGR